jgi:hypothetical protein
MARAPSTGPSAPSISTTQVARPARGSRWLLPLGALALGLLIYGYITAVLVPYQIGNPPAPNSLRGNLSDLYPRWLGTRELLWHGRDPYSADVTREIQVGYYGRALTPADTVTDQQGFAYPLYVVFLLAPLTVVDFALVKAGFGWLLLGLTAWSVPLWLRAIGWRLPAPVVLAAARLAAGSWPALQAWALEQLTALVAVLLAGVGYCLARGAATAEGDRPGPAINGWYAAAGVLLALATIKPQLTVLLIGGLALWVVSRWRARQAVAWGFAGAMALLLGGAFALMPGWVGEFSAALTAYQQYTNGRSILEFLCAILLGPVAPGAVDGATAALTAALALGAAAIWWQARRSAPGSRAFARALVTTLTITLLIIPTWAPYNQLLLIPGVAVLAREWPALRALGSRTVRALGILAAVMIGWPWVAAAGVLLWLTVSLAGGASCCAAPVYQVGWWLPLVTSVFGPPAVLAALAALWQRPPATAPETPAHG